MLTLAEAYIRGFTHGVQFANEVLAERADLPTDAKRVEDLKAVREFMERFPDELRKLAA